MEKTTLVVLLGIVGTFFFPLDSVWAVGTAANTTITNSVTASYSLGGVPAAPVIASTSFQVAEVIDAAATWQDGANVTVTTPDANRVLTFRLANTGNGTELFRLTRNDAVAGDAFNPSPSTVSIYLENGLAPGLQTVGANMDTVYNSGVNDPSLPADGTLDVYLLSQIPSGLADLNVGNVQLLAASTTVGAAGAVAGATLVGLGTGGVDAVVGTTNADAEATGGYIVSSVVVTVAKAVTAVLDPFLGTDRVPGAVVTYRITVDVTGTGIAENLVITDPIPANTTYNSNSIRVGGAVRTDASDGDNADFGASTANTVTVNFGNTASPATLTIDFNVTIN